MSLSAISSASTCQKKIYCEAHDTFTVGWCLCYVRMMSWRIAPNWVSSTEFCGKKKKTKKLACAQEISKTRHDHIIAELVDNVIFGSLNWSRYATYICDVSSANLGATSNFRSIAKLYQNPKERWNYVGVRVWLNQFRQEKYHSIFLTRISLSFNSFLRGTVLFPKFHEENQFFNIRSRVCAKWAMSKISWREWLSLSVPSCLSHISPSKISEWKWNGFVSSSTLTSANVGRPCPEQNIVVSNDTD